MLTKLKLFGYRLYKKVKSKILGLIFRRTATRRTKEEIISDLKKLGLKRNDTVIVHSSLKSIGFVIGGARTVIDALIEVLGPEGTLVIPTYTMITTMYDTCISESYNNFNVKNSKTHLGAIPSTFLSYDNISRSIHPTHSVSAIGKFARQITEDHHKGNRTFGMNSPWSKIIQLDGKILGIGISLGPTTQYHYVEDMMGDNFPIKVKTEKIYKLKCEIDDNKIIEVDVQPLDPEFLLTRIDQRRSRFIRDYFWEIFRNLKALKTGKIGGANSWIANLNFFCEIVEKLAVIGITIYSTEKELKKKGLYPFNLINKKII